MAVTVTCAQCGKTVGKRWPSEIRERNYCNKSCLGAYRSTHYIGPRSAHFKGGVSLERGRARVLMPSHPNAQKSGYVYRYRIVAEELLGRLLEDHEVVHHIDGNPGNDDPSNLIVTTQSIHASQYDARRKARTDAIQH